MEGPQEEVMREAKGDNVGGEEGAEAIAGEDTATAGEDTGKQ